MQSTYIQRPVVVSAVIHATHTEIAGVIEDEDCRWVEPLVDQVPTIAPSRPRDGTDRVLIKIPTWSPVEIGHDRWRILRLLLCSQET